MTDLRYAVRALAKHRGFTAVAVVTLALGIGANTAIFSVVNAVLLRRLPYPDDGRIVQLWSTTAADPRDNHSAGDFMDIQRGQRTLAALAGYREDATTIAAPDGEPSRVTGVIVTTRYFDVFGLPPLHGRTFAAADEASAEPLVVLGERAWRQHFAADPAAVGRRARLNGVPHTIVGVMPDAFDYPEDGDVWVLSPRPVPTPPLDIEGDLLESREVRYFNAVARVKREFSLDQATADLHRIAEDLARRFPATGTGRGLHLQPLHERIVGDVREALLILLGAVGLVLLIACANVSSLLLARGSGRQREMAIRAALGAGRARIVRQLITESLVLGLLGGAIGLLAGGWALSLLVAVIPDGIPRAGGIGLDATVAAVTVVVSCASAIVFGLVPALQASRTDSSTVLRAGDRGSSGDRRRARTRAVLVIAEVALTLVLLVCAGLLVNSFMRLERVSTGFRPDQVMLVGLPVPQAKYTDGKLQAAFYERVWRGLRERAEIQDAAILFPGPLQGNTASGSFTIEGRDTVTARTDRPRALLASISSGYFTTMGIPLIRGRDFTERDRDPAPTPVIVNLALAKRYWPGGDPIGARVRFGDAEEDWMEIVGLVGDSRSVSLDAEPAPLMYVPFDRLTLPFMSIAVRSPAGVGVVSSIARQVVREADPEVPIDRILPLREVIRESVAQPRFRTLLIGAFALLATVLAAVGVYGLVSFSVTQRTREIGIRIALGAGPEQVMLPVMRHGLVLGASGIVLGLAGAAAATRLLASFLFGVEPLDALTFSAVSVLLLGITLLASYIPSRRALRVDPITALRAE